MTALAAPPVTRQRLEVEALRGIAALSVLVGHVWGSAHDYDGTYFSSSWHRFLLAGGEGLALFFALSGYLLTRLLIRPGAPGPGRYLRHRAARIVPTWWFVLAFMLLLHADGVRKREWWRFPLLLQGFWDDTVARVDGPAWTLAVEAQFYLLLPLLALLLRGRLAWLWLGVLICGSLLLTWATVIDASPGLVWRYSLPANLVYFVPGIALAVAETRSQIVPRLQRLPHPRAVLLVLSAPLWLAFVFFPRTAHLSALAAGLSVAAVCLPLDEGRLVQALRSRALVVLGTLSFGVYLWHEPLTEVLPRHGIGDWFPLLLVVLPLSLLLAAISHLLVERPILRLRDGLSDDPRSARIAAVGALVAGVVLLVALVR